MQKKASWHLIMEETDCHCQCRNYDMTIPSIPVNIIMISVCFPFLLQIQERWKKNSEKSLLHLLKQRAAHMQPTLNIKYKFWRRGELFWHGKLANLPQMLIVKSFLGIPKNLRSTNCFPFCHLPTVFIFNKKGLWEYLRCKQ